MKMSLIFISALAVYWWVTLAESSTGSQQRTNIDMDDVSYLDLKQTLCDILKENRVYTQYQLHDNCVKVVKRLGDGLLCVRVIIC